KACLEIRLRLPRFGVPPLGGSRALPPEGGTPNGIFRQALKFVQRLLSSPEFLLQLAKIHLNQGRSAMGAGIRHGAVAKVLHEIFQLAARKRVVGFNGMTADSFSDRMFA